MSSVDPKPTYSRAVSSFISSLSLGVRDYQLRNELLARFDIDVSSLGYLDARDYVENKRLIEKIDDLALSEGAVDCPAFFDLVRDSGDAERDVLDPSSSKELALAILKFVGPELKVYTDSAAMYSMLHNIVWVKASPQVEYPSDLLKGLHVARGLSSAATACMKVNGRASTALADRMYLSARKDTLLEAVRREIAENLSYGTVSRRVRAAYSAIFCKPQSRLRRAHYPDGVNSRDILRQCAGRIRQDKSCAENLEYFYVGRIRIVKSDGVAYIMDTENIRKVYQVAHRIYMATLGAACEQCIMPVRSCVPVPVVRRLCGILLEAAASHAEQGRPLAGPARALHQIWCAEFTRAYEDVQPDGYAADWEGRYAEIMKSAKQASHYASRMVDAVADLPAILRLDALRMHHIMAAPDTPPELLAKLTFGAKDIAKAPDQSAWRSFMNFAKTYELCMYLFKKRKWPAVAGDEGAKGDSAYARCLRGKFSIPSFANHGKLYISRAFPYVRYADQLALRAKDATRVVNDISTLVAGAPRKSAHESNELLHALRYGNNIGSPRYLTIDQARDEFWKVGKDCHWPLDTAAKAEATKSDIKPRGTFSAPGEFRHIQAEFDRNCQVFNDFLGCGSIRADPVNHAKGMSRVAKGTRALHVTSSHDIEAWSQSQDRKAFCEFGEYRAQAFVGIDEHAWSECWKCFDCVIHRGGVSTWAHMDNGGFQGFPGTLDTSLHVLILCHFLWKMKQAGHIPEGQTALAKATIDDCLAQMQDWRGPLSTLEDEITAHYKSLGYTIDKVKSVISRCKAIYLNAAYVRGGHVAQGIKVFCKADRPLEIVLKTAIDDVGGVMSGAKAAIEQGMQPLAAYYGGAALACSYIVRASKHVHSLGLDAFVMLCLLPRGDGGIGFPSMGDLMTKEHPDARSSANHVLCQWARSRADGGHPVDQEAVSLWLHHKTVAYATVSKASIFFNPRAVKRAGVPEIESLRRQAVINAARNTETADPYKSVLASANNTALNDVYSALLNYAHHGVDCSFLEAYTSHLPERVLDALVGKVTSYRVARELLGDRDVVRIQNAMQHRFDDLVSTAVRPATFPQDTIDRARDSLEHVSGYERASAEREEFLTLNNVVLLNHTVPSPFEVIAVAGMHSGVDTLPHIGSSFGELLTFAPDAPMSSKTTLSPQGIVYPFKSKNWVADSADEYKYLDQPSHTFVEGCAVLEWARLKGLNIDSWEFVYMHRWLGHNAVSSSDFVTHALQGSIKRSAAAAGDRYHPIFGLRNIVRSVKCNVAPLLTILGEKSTTIDPMSIIASAYAIGAINMAVVMDSFGRTGIAIQEFSWSIGLLPATLEESTPVEVYSQVPMEFLKGVFEIELDHLCFLRAGGGTERMLSKLCHRGALAALLNSLVTVSAPDDAGMLAEVPDAFDVSPMFVEPTSPPETALFLAAPAHTRPTPMLVNDTFHASTRVRLLEISPSAPRLCAIAALQGAAAELGTSRIAEWQVSTTVPWSEKELRECASRVAVNTLSVLRNNIPSSLPLVAAAQGMRAAGMASFRWDNPNPVADSVFVENFTTYVAHNVKEFVSSVRRTCRELVSAGNIDYSASSPAVRVHRDPESANIRERTVRLRKKLNARVALYKHRIKAAKAGTSKLSRDMPDDYDDKQAKLAYLAGAMSFMNSVVLEDGPTVNWPDTAVALNNRFKDKVESHEFPYRGSVAMFHSISGVINRRGVEEANQGPVERWWRPDAFSRGVEAASEWIVVDAVNERKEVYYVPSTVKVSVRVRHEHIVASFTPPTGMNRSPAVPAATLIPSSGSSHSQKSRSRGSVSSVAPSSSGSSFNPLAAFAASRRTNVRTIGDYTQFVSTLAMGAVCCLLADMDAPLPASISMLDRQRIFLMRHRVTEDTLEPQMPPVLRATLARHMFSVRAQLVAPDLPDDEEGAELAH
jgi:hypothetical protein